MNWQDLEVEAAELAVLGREALTRARVGLLGTLRMDGSPRISPIEPYFSAGHLLFGAIAWSLKVRDLRRDPRCVLHSAITGPDAGESELKLYGRAESPGSRPSCVRSRSLRHAPGCDLYLMRCRARRRLAAMSLAPSHGHRME